MGNPVKLYKRKIILSFSHILWNWRKGFPVVVNKRRVLLTTVVLHSNKYLPLQDMASFFYPANVEVIKSGPRSKAELAKNKKESGVFCGFHCLRKRLYHEEGTTGTN